MDGFYFTCAAVIFFVVGVCIGSFSNVVIYRLPREMSLAKPPSHCPVCGTRLSWKDNIPLFSFLFLRGRCRYCGTPISPRYFVVELTSGLMWLALLVHFQTAGVWQAAVWCLAASVLLCIAFCDAENLFIPDSLQCALVILAVAVCAFEPNSLWDRLIGAAAGGGFYLLFYLGSLAVLRREGIGFGDVKLMAAMGLLLGTGKVIFTIVLGSVLALLLPLLPARMPSPDEGPRAAQREFPLAPPLVAAGIVAIFAGDFLLNIYAAFL